jgi:glucose-1-phosphate cytidylyltransferase
MKAVILAGGLGTRISEETDVKPKPMKETRGKISFQSFLDLYVENQFTCWDQNVIAYCFNSYVKFQNSYIYNYFPNLNFEKIGDFENIKEVEILHFAGGPKPWQVAPWEAKKLMEYLNARK